jgi:hypothetical protein
MEVHSSNHLCNSIGTVEKDTYFFNHFTHLSFPTDPKFQNGAEELVKQFFQNVTNDFGCLRALGPSYYLKQR